MAKNEKELRANGFMTIEEFVETFTPALSQYLHHTWSFGGDGLHHPEDLLANASAFMEAMYVVVQHFGLGQTNK